MMPEDTRDCAYDPEEEYPWDADNSAAGEADTHDLVNPDEEGDE